MNKNLQLFNITSQLSEEIYQFYLDQEKIRDDAPLAPWREGSKLKGSDFYVEMQIFTDEVPEPSKKHVSSPNFKQKFELFSWIPFKQELNELFAKIINTPIKHDPLKMDLVKEVAESRVEAWTDNHAKKREPWKKVFYGTGLRIIFKGGAGSGKSFSLSQEVRQRIAIERNRLENFSCCLNDLELPIFIKASALVNSDKESIEEIFLSTLSKSSKSISPQLEKWIKEAFSSEKGRRLFLIIDGLDEIPAESQTIFRERMQELNVLESANIVVSCRTMYFETRRDWIGWTGENPVKDGETTLSKDRIKVVELAPLEENQQIELIKKIIKPGNNSTQTLLEVLKKNYSLNLFCRVPFILTSACLLYSDNKQNSSKDITYTYALLYDALTKKFLRGDWREVEKRPKWLELPEVSEDRAQTNRLTMLSQICWFLFEASPSENHFTQEQWLTAYEKIKNKNQVINLTPEDVLINPSPGMLLEELVAVGMVMVAGYYSKNNIIKEKYYSFSHRTILEYFAAFGLINQFEEKQWVKTLVDHMWCENDWVEVIRFAASLTDNPLVLLQSVAKASGYVSIGKRPFQRLANLGSSLTFYTIVFIAVFTAFAAYVIWNSNDSKSQLEHYVAARKPYFDNLESLWQTSKNNLNLLEYATKDHKSFWSDLGNYFSFGLTELYKYYPAVKYEVISAYDFIFAFLRHESLQSQATITGTVWSFWVTQMHFLLPMLLAGIVGLFILRIVILWSDRSLFYWIDSAKKDDIFLTGLRVQAEIIGYSNAAHKLSGRDIKRVVQQLLAASQMYGASDEERIPEDLLLLLGGNQIARERLNRHWVNLIDKKQQALSRYNWIYGKIEPAYLRLIYFTRRNPTTPSFTKGSFKRLPRLAGKLIPPDPYYGETNQISKYLYDRFPADLQKSITQYSRKKWTKCIYLKIFYKHLRVRDYRVRLGLLRKYAKQRQETVSTNFTASMNAVLQDQSLFTGERFQGIRLRTETRDLLKQNPTGDDLIYLNRLLLEEAYPKGIRRIQKKWLRFVGWAGRLLVKDNLLSKMQEQREFSNNSELSRAFRGLKLLPDTRNRSSLANLLEDLSEATINLVDNKITSRRFTQLDVTIAKTLAMLEVKTLANAENSTGKEKLAEIASESGQDNELSPIVIKELSMLDGKQAIKLALARLNKKWEKNYSPDVDELYSTLSDLPHEMAIAELCRLSVEEKRQDYFDMVLVPFLKKVGGENIDEWLQKIAGDKSNQALAKAARKKLETPSETRAGGDKWVEKTFLKINEFLESKKFDSAIDEFDRLISPPKYDNDYYYTSEDFLNNSKKITAFCQTKLLEGWFRKHGGHVQVYKNLVLLAKEPGGQIIRKFLIELAQKVHLKPYLIEVIGAVWLALGDLDDPSKNEANPGASHETEMETPEEALLKILKKTRRLSYSFKARFGEYYKRERFIQYLLGGLGKIGSDAALEQILREVTPKSWETYYIAARLLAERDDPRALKFLLKGQKERGSKGSWDNDFGDEPTVRDLAKQFGAQIVIIETRGFKEYLVNGQSRNFKYRVRA